ncbi:MFS transporter [Alkanindiges hydrocarboniclasticus]|jgi:MFS transporter, PPP family, 3-phenylpropionic acid transporter|uniref:MFS transporter n=1 Tax=Alkanindiges hydrocarboniclasticus TaxID=1907941 RepID=A0A1S8D0L6_9GAMM|nr:MFS transporter [Alkanindiges hydrocarboniclasticus]ONG42276.1 MFS transporter [Alkanindiges hydrocarboniclasticus]
MTPSISGLYKISGFYFLYYAVVGAFMPYWSLYLEDQGFSRATIGLLASITVLTRIFAPIAWGWLADRTGKRMRWVRLATLMECIIWLSIFLLPNTLGHLAILMFVFSFFQNAILAQFEAVTLFWLGAQRESLYGKVRRWGSVGFIVAVFILGKVFDIISIHYLPMLLMLIAGLTWAWSWQIHEPKQAPPAQKQLSSIFPVLKQPLVWRFFSIEFLLLLSHAPFYSFYSNYLKDYGYSTGTTGLLWSLGVVAEIVMFSQSRHLLARFKQHQLIALCLIVTSLRWILVASFPQFLSVQIIAQCLHAFSFGLFHVLAMRVIFNSFLPAQQGRAQALYSTMWGLGVALGSLLAGHYWQAYGGNAMFYAAALVVLLGLFFLSPRYVVKTQSALDL